MVSFQSSTSGYSTQWMTSLFWLTETLAWNFSGTKWGNRRNSFLQWLNSWPISPYTCSYWKLLHFIFEARASLSWKGIHWLETWLDFFFEHWPSCLHLWGKVGQIRILPDHEELLDTYCCRQSHYLLSLVFSTLES